MRRTFAASVCAAALAFDAAESALPADVAAVFAPLRAVHRRLLGEPTEAPVAMAAESHADRLAVGLEQVMAAPDPVLRGYAEPLRVRMLELALDPGIPPALADRAAGVLLASIGHTGKTYAQLALRRAAQLLARHVDDRARAVLEELRRAAPGLHVAERWLAALDAKHMGRVALAGGATPDRGRLLPAFWLDGQVAVWLRTAPATAGDAIAAEAALQESLALPGVAPVVEHGVASGIPYVAVLAPGHPFALDDDRRRDLPTRLTLAAQAVRILRALALAGVSLPDADPERFCIAGDRNPTLTLADLDGARKTSPDEAAQTNTTAAAALIRRLAPTQVAPLADDLIALAQAIDDVILRTPRS